MSDKSLGQTIRDLRHAKGISVRELARKCDVSAPFMSDVELGRRYPSDEVLQKVARALGVSLSELKTHDRRESVTEFKRIMEANPSLGVVFQSVVDDLKTGSLSPQELAKMLKRKR